MTTRDTSSSSSSDSSSVPSARTVARYYASTDGSLVSTTRRIAREATRAVYLASEVDPLLSALASETLRRKHMQVMGRHLGWGFPDDGLQVRERAGVCYTDQHGESLYKPRKIFEFYADHDGDRDATERAVIDKAIAAAQEMEGTTSENFAVDRAVGAQHSTSTRDSKCSHCNDLEVALAERAQEIERLNEELDRTVHVLEDEQTLRTAFTARAEAAGATVARLRAIAEGMTEHDPAECCCRGIAGTLLRIFAGAD